MQSSFALGGHYQPSCGLNPHGLAKLSVSSLISAVFSSSAGFCFSLFLRIFLCFVWHVASLCTKFTAFYLPLPVEASIKGAHWHTQRNSHQFWLQEQDHSYRTLTPPPHPRTSTRFGDCVCTTPSGPSAWPVHRKWTKPFVFAYVCSPHGKTRRIVQKAVAAGARGGVGGVLSLLGVCCFTC